MSYSIDANILLYASDQGSPHHAAALDFLNQRAAVHDLLYLCWPTIFAYLRISTHPSIFSAPLSPAAARANIDALLSLPQTRCIGESHNFWASYDHVCQGLVVRGNLVPDAQIAAILAEHGIRRLYSRDRDFLKFPHLEVIDPFA